MAGNQSIGHLSSGCRVTESLEVHSEVRILSAQTRQKDSETSFGLKETTSAFVMAPHHALERDSGDVDCARDRCA